MKIVLDSNILVSAIGKRSPLRPIWQSFVDGKYQLIVSEHILKEYEEILEIHSAPGAVQIVMEIFIEAPNVISQNIYYNWDAIIADADDNKFFDVAIASNADFLVTNDRHFDAVKNNPFPKVKIINSDEFLTLLR
ncbi:putative PIN family toxin of toxin-antitoxin system [Mucilaginibacter yixingensis]|uniref:Putative PIN family toxin of toxin-antitoxin system n=1 Tax=Mucilaginibacter yixingensis TaxID=1295612 RepID=A0A2T5JD21_9SPHI|nr:putative toxin-antitoxin system toxin component, PIN family [Mucilaginibacter yixingensis]PTQ99565.1 putative PIN family toxin of toxin-antitoxin system [Mucilaginibacter yixingensis]